jgi:hypothetical protein
MGQPPSIQALRCKVTLMVDTSRNLCASGTVGSTPLVFVVSWSDFAPTPILKEYEKSYKE